MIKLIFSFLGLLLSLAGLVLLVVFASLKGSPIQVVSYSIFGASLVLFYLVRGLYLHRENLKLLDQLMIFFLTAATYTPIALLLPEPGWAWSLFGVVWGLTLFSMLLRGFKIFSMKPIMLFFYGSLLILNFIFSRTIHHDLSFWSAFWLSLGSASYTLETFLVLFGAKLWKSLQEADLAEALAFPFVILGSFCHFWAFLELLP